jgi:heterodisulfide reductase subunit B
MDYTYFPGCTLSTKATSLDRTARECARVLGFGLTEMRGWTCCGATFPLATDNLMALLPPARLLARAREEGRPLTTLCSVCFNVLKRTNRVMAADAERRDKLNGFLETAYEGDLRVVHYLEVLRDDLGFEALRGKVTRPLSGLGAAAYYGCMLLRPADEMGFDDPERPRVFEDFLAALGADPVDHPHRAECCGSFQAVGSPEVAVECAHRVLSAAAARGADCLVSTCPLCSWNLDARQEAVVAARPGFRRLPVFYFTQLLGLALGLDAAGLGLDGNAVDPQPLLRARGLAGA